MPPKNILKIFILFPWLLMLADRTVAASPEISKEPYIDARAYTSLAEAVDAAGAAQTTLLVSTPQKVLSNKTIPSNISLWFVNGGALALNPGITVTLNGPVQ